jgi:sensor histidine kinase regulating citrate/malate metabolism
VEDHGSGVEAKVISGLFKLGSSTKDANGAVDGQAYCDQARPQHPGGIETGPGTRFTVWRPRTHVPAEEFVLANLSAVS